MFHRMSKLFCEIRQLKINLTLKIAMAHYMLSAATKLILKCFHKIVAQSNLLSVINTKVYSCYIEILFCSVR